MARLLWLADVLRAAGLTVVEHAGWQTHARPGDWDPLYGVVHATAAPRTQTDSVQIGIVRNGRSDLPGPIANACVDRLGRWHVLSAGRCNTTLAGTAGPYKGLGNTNGLGVEACNDNQGEPWPAVQYDAYVRGEAAICRRLGWTAAHLVGHKEHCPGRKTDPTFDMDRFRRDVAAVLNGDDVAFDDNDMHFVLTKPVFPYESPTQSLGTTWLGAFSSSRAAASASAEIKSLLVGQNAAIKALADLVNQGGGSVNDAAILKAITDRATEDKARDDAHAAEIAELHAEIVRLTAALAAAGKAQAALG